MVEAPSGTQQPMLSSGQPDRSRAGKKQSQHIDTQDKTRTQQVGQESQNEDQHNANTQDYIARSGVAGGPDPSLGDGDSGNRKGTPSHEQMPISGPTANLIQGRSWTAEVVKQNRTWTQGLRQVQPQALIKWLPGSKTNVIRNINVVAPFLRTMWMTLDESAGNVTARVWEAQLLLQNRRAYWEWTSIMFGEFKGDYY